MIEDDLQRNTDPLQSSEGNDTRQIGDDDEFDMEDQQLEDFLNCLDEETDECFNDYNENIPSYLNCDVIRKRGRFNCGYENLPSVNLNSSDDVPFVEHTLQEINLLPNIANIDIDNRNEDPSQQTIVRIMLTKTSKELHSFQELNGSSEQKEVMQPSGSTESIIDWAEKSGLDAYQRRAFEIITGTFVLSFYETANFSNTSMLGYSTRSIFNNEKCRLEELVGIQKRQRDKQLILFLHGPAGSGKTAVIDLVVTYSTSYCKFLWEGFSNNEQVIVITAMTGVAATLIRGQTTHSALFLNQIKDINAEQIELWFSTRMLIIDEISFGCSEDVQNMDSKTRKLKQQRDKKYGGIPVVVFSGDLRQLEPVGDKLPLYDEPGITIFENFINCYIELGGIHRFKFNPKWGEILLRFRDGDVTLEDIEIINSRIPEDDTIIPEDVRYATYFNADRDAINSAIFQERVEQIYNEKKNTNGFIIVFSDHLKFRNSDKKYVSFRRHKLFWEHCGEDDINMDRRGRMDPVLKLYQGCRVMLPTNTNVDAGLANGTQARIQKVVLKANESGSYLCLNNNIPVLAVFASQVDHIVLKHSNSRIEPEIFHLKPKEHTFKANIPKPWLLKSYSNKKKKMYK
jgi:hypothetical protein